MFVRGFEVFHLCKLPQLNLCLFHFLSVIFSLLSFLGPLSKRIGDWGTDEVSLWLESVGFAEYVEIFKQHDIHGSELIALEKSDLQVSVFCL